MKGRIRSAATRLPGQAVDKEHFPCGTPGHHRRGSGRRGGGDSRLLAGFDGRSGQIGHLPISDSGPLCERGHRGCARSYLAEPLIRRQLAQATGDPEPSYCEFIDLARSGHRTARRVAQDAGRAPGELIGTAAAVTGPERVIISGEGVEILDLVLPQMRKAAQAAQHWTLEPVPTTVLPFTTTEWARGAAIIALRRQLELPSTEI